MALNSANDIYIYIYVCTGHLENDLTEIPQLMNVYMTVNQWVATFYSFRH